MSNVAIASKESYACMSYSTFGLVVYIGPYFPNGDSVSQPRCDSALAFGFRDNPFLSVFNGAGIFAFIISNNLYTPNNFESRISS